jgi:acyl-CoA thioester hydrolase
MPEPHRFDVRVYYEDTDFSGNVYHAAYLEFEAAAHIDDLLTVETEPAGVTGARLSLTQSIRRGSTRLVEAQLVVVAIRADGRPARLPREVLALARGGDPD